MKDKNQRFQRRKRRVRGKVSGTTQRPRLSIYRSKKYLYAQIIDDLTGNTLVGASSKKNEVKGSKVDQAFALGEVIAKKAIALKIKSVVFDKSGYKYHGRVKSFAEGARKGGLEF